MKEITSSQTNHIIRGLRQSNFELLRLFAMFLVLIVHADFWTLGRPTISDFSTLPLQSFVKILIESISVVCVNCFILISGWFGIRATWKGFWGFIFQCLYFIVGLYIIAIVLGYSKLDLNGIWECLLLSPNSWFIHSYIGLYVLSPVLNIFLEKASKNVISGVLITFFLYQSTFGWLNGAQYFRGGYSAISFCGLYLLAAYTKRYLTGYIENHGARLYIASIIINTFLYYAVTFIGFPIDSYAYINPFIILGALGIILWFSKLKIHSNKIINRLAASAFAVYLFHTETSIGVKLFKPIILSIFTAYSGIRCILIILPVLVAFFLGAIIIDQPRYLIWNLVSKKFLPK